MIRKLLIAFAATALLPGCVTDYGYRGGDGDYYYGHSTSYGAPYGSIGYGAPYSTLGYGYPGGWYGSIGYGWYGGYGSYWGDRYGPPQRLGTPRYYYPPSPPVYYRPPYNGHYNHAYPRPRPINPPLRPSHPRPPNSGHHPGPRPGEHARPPQHGGSSGAIRRIIDTTQPPREHQRPPYRGGHQERPRPPGGAGSGQWQRGEGSAPPRIGGPSNTPGRTTDTNRPPREYQRPANRGEQQQRPRPPAGTGSGQWQRGDGTPPPRVGGPSNAPVRITDTSRPPREYQRPSQDGITTPPRSGGSAGALGRIIDSTRPTNNEQRARPVQRIPQAQPVPAPIMRQQQVPVRPAVQSQPRPAAQPRPVPQPVRHAPPPRERTDNHDAIQQLE